MSAAAFSRPAIFPAVDLRGGRFVRLIRGARSEEIPYGDDPVAAARRWADAGTEWLHVIDLGGAFGERDNLEVMLEIARAVPLRIQSGGGLRDDSRIERLLAGGVHRVIIGTRALEDPPFLRRLIARHGPERVVLALDVAGDRVKVKGWEADSGMDFAAGLRFAQDNGVETILLTAIDRDGTLSGASLSLVRRALEEGTASVVVAGGIGSLDDIRAVLELRHPRLDGVVVGRALYEGTVVLADALGLANEYQVVSASQSAPGVSAALDSLLGSVKYDANGLVPAVVQDSTDGQVLMVAYMNRESLRRTLSSGVTCFWSRSRKEFWVKGATSGNTQKVVRVAIDCDQDCVLVVVEQKGVACHTGKRSCFYREAGTDGALREIDTARPLYQPR